MDENAADRVDPEAIDRSSADADGPEEAIAADQATAASALVEAQTDDVDPGPALEPGTVAYREAAARGLARTDVELPDDAE
jgi:hypothetical protein